MNPAIIPSAIEANDVLAICTTCGRAYCIVPVPRCECGGSVRLLVDPMSLERYERLRCSRAWQELRTRRVE